MPHPISSLRGILRNRCRFLIPFSQNVSAGASKQTVKAGEVVSVRPRSPSGLGEQRLSKAPKLGAHQSPSGPRSGRVSHELRRLSHYHPFSSNREDLSLANPERPRPSGRRKGKRNGSQLKSQHGSLPELDGPMHDAVYIEKQHRASIRSRPEIKPALADNPKSPLMNFALHNMGSNYALKFDFKEYFDSNANKPVTRKWYWLILYEACTLDLATEPRIVAVGDHTEKKAAERLCCLSALYQLYDKGLLDKSSKTSVQLSDGSVVNYERARSFMDYYCRIYNFGKPDIEYQQQTGKRKNAVWEAFMIVGGRRIGVGSGSTKKIAFTQCYLDVTRYLESCDPELWGKYVEAAQSGKDLGLAPRDLCRGIKRTALYTNQSAIRAKLAGSPPSALRPAMTSLPKPSYPRHYPPHSAKRRSELLKKRREVYLDDPGMEKMRSTRAALPIFTRSKELLGPSTGSGKTTQIPQIILNDHIDRGEGAHCNIICTQPRRLAALSVAERVAKERGETVGSGSIGYSVRFESKLPEEHGSITFCTIGVLLRRIQSAMTEGGIAAAKLDEITHIVVDEVHERDVDTDLLLVVLRRMLQDRKARNVPLKIFQEYFSDKNGGKAPVIDIPGRTFPVKKQYLEDFIEDIKRHPRLSWIFNDESVTRYLEREGAYAQSYPALPLANDEVDTPSPLIAGAICHVLQRSHSGHVLVFLPGWEDIMGVQLPLDFNDETKYSIHLLHSSVPLAEQQVIFEPPAEGVRRVILATNIAETSVTIPDVVYVVDTAKVKEVRYDPSRHIGPGRAGRHRPGEYYGLLSRARMANLAPHQTVEMKRVDLSNVVMHVKALSLPDMEVEEVLAETIEPPDPDRVAAAMKVLQMVGALDNQKNLTSLGRLLLQLPVEVQMGRLALHGVFFRCLDQAVTLAVILTNRDPFVSPMHLKSEAAAAKTKWSPAEFRSDALTILNAYNAWHEIHNSGDYARANRFCSENFLSKPTLLLIRKIRYHLLQSLYQAGVIDVTEGVGSYVRERHPEVPSALNVNGNSEPLLAALIAVASQPKYAVRTGDKTLRTQYDKTTFIHPSSVNHRKHIRPTMEHAFEGEKQIYAFAEKRQNLTVAGQNPQTFLINTTRLDPMTYLLFGANDILVTERGLECDGWLPLVGNLAVLDDIQRLKALMETCMLRVYDGILMNQRRWGRTRRWTIPARDNADEADDDDFSVGDDLSISPREVTDLDMITRDCSPYIEPHLQSQSTSRSATPTASPAFSSSKLPNIGSRSGYATPYGAESVYNSRPAMSSRLSKGFKFP
ncbi:P-loop containing nucleoside triphosphate hydrolase protein [Pisolithus microcarpus]|nr:P-loop containing nucleoside triphosphate hydrolase protein [Pisolithus microcarpus]